MYACIKGDSLLHVICKQGWVDAADAVLKRGADMNVANKVCSMYSYNLSITLLTISSDFIGGTSTDRCGPEKKRLGDEEFVDKMEFLL